MNDGVGEYVVVGIDVGVGTIRLFRRDGPAEIAVLQIVIVRRQGLRRSVAAARPTFHPRPAYILALPVRSRIFSLTEIEVSLFTFWARLISLSSALRTSE